MAKIVIGATMAAGRDQCVALRIFHLRENEARNFMNGRRAVFLFCQYFEAHNKYYSFMFISMLISIQAC